MSATPALPISVIIPTHNTRELTLRCLETVDETRPAPGEVIVVDDGSRDGTGAAIRERWPEVVLLANKEPLGFSGAANRGLAQARGEILLLLNSDTELSPSGLASLTAAFGDQLRLGVAGASLLNLDGSPQWSGGRDPGLFWFFALASRLPALLAWVPGYRRLHSLDRPGEVEWVTGAALAVRRQAWEVAGPLDEGYRFYAQDLALCATVRAAGFRVAVVPGFEVRHHLGATVAQGSGCTSDGVQLSWLWGDLLRWATLFRGERWARRARRLLRLGGGMRRGVLRARSLVSSGVRRQELGREIQALDGALEVAARHAPPPVR